MLLASAASHALPEKRQPASVSNQFYTLHPPGLLSQHQATGGNPLAHKLESGMTVRGIKLSNSMFLTQCKQGNGHKGLGLSLQTGDYLYQLGTDYLNVSFLF